MAGADPIETYRGAVAAWECDAFGHMNIALYPQRFEAGARDLMERAGSASGWRTVALHVRYLEELRAAEGIVIRSGLLEREGASVRLAHEALKPSGERTTLAEHVLRHDDAAFASVSLAPIGGWERFSPPGLPRGEGTLATARTRARATLCEDGALTTGGYTHCFSDANLFVMEAIGMSSAYRSASNRGFATFETLLSLEGRPAAPGDGLVVTSGIVAVGASSLRLLHRMRASADGQLLAQFYQAGVHFDLALRRSAPWLPELRANAEKLVLAAL
ncbi:MAG TPA: acyl-[acyl-carrier-protein] thioesterase [Stellaceae bacterium]|nr:acyl-[acyl-carrier-protein] thioesterase [Stellaceae bacterium]